MSILGLLLQVALLSFRGQPLTLMDSVLPASELGNDFANLLEEINEFSPLSFPHLSSFCSVSWSKSIWLYDQSGLERRPAFYNPILSQPENWNSGWAVLGTSTFNFVLKCRFTSSYHDLKFLKNNFRKSNGCN